ncbi:hypothetical protein Kpol_1013p1 [Vanderwaltozyma polyspora DSM 70294]|uniref:RRM domain-containing protein n=1 Tax=Vanderwaltozyma polyspora (strain ATCC 22028 / DSM 70294 / BCRC 21397 / CBS 2163 / NBRC 10782 / NRRL Y-8283 / UCD 57-17) TaxID=436907 RepID=A7TH49_VANPO|nr:uncharacterized protein Kpol_1013p1 [Vanderwaltozyma polyspora DSM 70294]EDO18330.1 hypothetical protein Kpol_1013p1 [Vanderwaltozyma polyspora DSM 70294]
MSSQDSQFQRTNDTPENKVFQDVYVANVSKSRIPSLSSLFLNNTIEEKNHEFIGFRRFARTYILGTERSVKSKVTKPKSQLNITNMTYQSNGDYLSHGEYLNELPKEKIYLENKLELAREHQASTNMSKVNVPGEIYDYEVDQFGVPQKIPDLTYEDDDMDYISPSEGKISTTNSSEDIEMTNTGCDLKKVVLRNIPVGTGVRSILSQICGGPLESLIVQTKPDSHNELSKVELSFLTYEGAWAFMKYGRTTLFQINGIQLNPEWGKLSSSKSLNYANLSKSGTGDCKDISRCLILKKYINRNDTRHGTSKEHLIERFDIEELKSDFERFGDIFDITPIVSRKLCVSISYNHILGAMTAMDDYEDSHSLLHQKYFRTWAIWYGKDITDKPCIEL